MTFIEFIHDYIKKNNIEIPKEKGRILPNWQFDSKEVVIMDYEDLLKYSDVIFNLDDMKDLNIEISKFKKVQDIGHYTWHYDGKDDYKHTDEKYVTILQKISIDSEIIRVYSTHRFMSEEEFKNKNRTELIERMIG